MKYADCAGNTALDPGGSTLLMGILLNQTNGLKLLQFISRPGNGHHVHYRATTFNMCWCPLLVSNISISKAEAVESMKSRKLGQAGGADRTPSEFCDS